MKILLISILFTFSAWASFGQVKAIHGEIRNSETQSAIQFVNIGIKNKSTGTVSNSKGLFALKLNEKVTDKDTITISHIGFKTKNILCNQLVQETNVIELQPEYEDLKEVTVKFVKPKPRKIGRNSKGLGLMHMNFYSFYENDVDDRLSKEVGMQFKLKKDCKLNDFNFNITSNEFKSLKFRLNFYQIEAGLPKKIVIDQDIIFEIKDGFLGWYTLDLKPYKLYLDKEIQDYAVTIQWIESIKMNEKSKYFGISTAMSATETSFFREKAMDVWSKSAQSLSFYLNALCK